MTARAAGRRPNLLPAMALFLLALAFLGGVTANGFVELDDYDYVVEKPLVNRGLRPGSMLRAFTATHSANWHPLTWLSHMLDVELFGLAPGGHHLTSLLLHASAGALLCLALQLMTGATWRPVLAAGLFLLHPLHVESVAWVAERKDVLAGFWWMLALLAWAAYARRPGPWRYAGAAAAFGLGLLSKPTLVTLPLVLLLLDWWPLGRLRRAVGGSPGKALLEKVPLLAMAAAAGLATLAAQSRWGAVVTLAALGPGERAANALVSAVRYLRLTLWPSGLSVFYPMAPIPAWKALGAAGLLAAACATAVGPGRRRPWLAVGWGWYLVTLLPVAGLVQVGEQAMADRYTYLPLAGIFLLAAWAAAEPARPGARRAAVAGLAAAAILLCGLGAWRRVAQWRDSFSLFGHDLAVTRDNHVLLNSLGVAYARRGDGGQAAACYRAAMAAKPDYPAPWFNLGYALSRQGRWAEAAAHFGRAVELKPDYAEAHQNLGAALAQLGRLGEAMPHYELAARLLPGYADPWANMGIAHERLGRPAEAEAAFREAVRLEPLVPLHRFNLGLFYLRHGRIEEARGELRALLELDRETAEALEALMPAGTRP